MDEKIKRLAERWAQWNRKEITGNDFALAFLTEFHAECMMAWNKKQAIFKLSEEYLNHAWLKGALLEKAKARRFLILKKLPYLCPGRCDSPKSTPNGESQV